MKRVLSTCTLFFTLIFSFSQTKEELIQGIIKLNSLDGRDGILNSECRKEIVCEHNNYYNFEKLKKLLTEQELLELSKHKNEILKLYAIRELISQNNLALDLENIILEEIKRNKSVQTHQGCIKDQNLTYSIIYHDYWNQVRINALKKTDEKDEKLRDKLMLDAINNDQKLIGINEAILKLDKDIYWLIYERIFQVEKYDDSIKSNIENLLFQHNNSYALKYLEKNYSSEFGKISDDYFGNYFPKQKFKDKNQTFYLLDLAKDAFENKNIEVQNMILNKLRSTDGWKKELGGTFEYQIFKKYNVKL